MSGATASGTDSTAYGQGAVASGSNSTSVGVSATASAGNSSAYGSGASAAAENSVALGANSVADEANTISVGSVGNERKITSVAYGNEATDAAAYGQLLETNARVNMLESSVTSVSGATASGVDGTAYGRGSVASGDNSTSMGVNARASAGKSSAYGNGSSAAAENSVALGANSVADRANTVSVGSIGSERQITNIADGTAGTDAVNLRQLNRVGAMAAALATSNSHQYDPDAKGQLTIGTGFYGDELAFALGFDYFVDESVRLSAGLSNCPNASSDGGLMCNFGISFKLGRSKESKTEAEQWEIIDDSLQTKIDQLQMENQRQKEQIDRQQGELEKLRADVELLKQLINEGQRQI
ncbi:MAG: hypothetical protein GX998_10015 [Firmicutes bacterium]|nr:hypothetical protein [Bacillota bacterium]